MILNKLAIELFGWSFEWLLISERNIVLRENKRRRALG